MYDDFYRLKAKAFQPNPDPAFFFASRSHNRALAYLKHGALHQGDGFVVITGDSGSGKTTLLRSLIHEADRERVTVGQLVSTRRDADDFLNSVCLAFGFSTAGMPKAEVMAAFESFLRSLRERGRRVLLVVDEAQNLSGRALDELRLLSDLQVDGRALLQCFLAGQSELREALRSPALQPLRQRVAVSFHLSPLSKDEVGAYVLHRLKHVGWNGDPELDPGLFDLLFRESGGVPRVINALCDRLLESGAHLAKHALTAADLSETIRDIREEFSAGSAPPAPGEPSDAPQPHLAGVVRLPTVAALMSRFDRIEQAVATAHDLLSRLAQSDEAGGREAESERRFRFWGRASR